MKVWFSLCALAMFAMFVLGAFGRNEWMEENEEGFLVEDPAFCNAENVEEPLVFDNEPSDLDYLSGAGRVTLKFQEPFDEEKAMKSIGLENREEVLSFMTNSPLVPIGPLPSEQVGSLFYLIIAFLNADVSIRGRLDKITFQREKEELFVFAEIDVDLSGIVERFRLSFLPQSARFSVFVPLCIKNSDLSADSEKIKVRCESMDLPESLLCYGCDVVFKQREYKRFFAETVGNVVRNACF